MKRMKELEPETCFVRFLRALPLITVKKKDDGSINFLEMFTINHQGRFFLIWNFLVTVCCLISSYIYLAMAAFRLNGEDDVLALILIILFEGIFCLDIVINSMLSYERNDT